MTFKFGELMKKIKTIGCLSALGVFGVGEIVSVSSCKANNINVSVIGINTDGKKDQKTTDTLTIATSVHINNLSVNDVKIINLKQPQRKISVSDVQSNNYAEYNIKIFGE
jgi:hypothetical protein